MLRADSYLDFRFLYPQQIDILKISSWIIIKKFVEQPRKELKICHFPLFSSTYHLLSVKKILKENHFLKI